MLIRNGTEQDLDIVEALHIAAFTSTRFGYQGEAALIRKLLMNNDTLVSLIAEEAHQAVGHVLFSRMTVVSDVLPLRAAALAPVGVLPERHGTGVGTALIRAGLDALSQNNIQISFVLGDSAYYSRFGYSAEIAKPFVSPYAGPHFMALFLDKSLTLPESGQADYAAAFSA